MKEQSIQTVKRLFTYVILTAGAAVTLLPFAWMVLSSIKDASEIIIMPPRLFPAVPRFDNYIKALKVAPFGIYFINTAAVTIISTVLTIITTILAAYAFSRLKFPGRDIIFSVLLATLMIPGEMLIITNYVTVSRLGWIDSRTALIVPWIANVFYIYFIKQFFMQMPEILYYAAKVDACSDWRYLWKVLVPCNKHAIATVGILNAINCWNSFLWPLIVTNSEDKRVLSIGLVRFQTEAGTQYELLMAASCILVFPVVILYLALRKYIINGVTRSGIKG